MFLLKEPLNEAGQGDYHGLDQSGSSGGGKKWSDSGYILKIESNRFC